MLNCSWEPVIREHLLQETGIEEMLYKKLLKPVFFAMEPESAHHLVIKGLSVAANIPGMLNLLEAMYGQSGMPELEVELFGLKFPNPLGLAAGLDKNGQAVPAFSRLGLGFMEVGTVTPRPQPGNDKPRLFRLPEYEALINRMGFNNIGAYAMAINLQKSYNNKMPLGINIGKNKTTPNERAEDDYRECIRTLHPYGDFFVVNISSPNTPDLRKLQHGEELAGLLSAVTDEMEKQEGGGRFKPVLVKIAPDLSDEELQAMLETILSSRVSGIIATNTTLSREGLNHRHAHEAGGLSGKPLRNRSTEIIRKIYQWTAGKLPIIGSGGVFDGQDAYEKICAGASLVEIYTGLVYEGPEVIGKICVELKALLEKDGFSHISQAVGAAHRK